MIPMSKELESVIGTFAIVVAALGIVFGGFTEGREILGLLIVGGIVGAAVGLIVQSLKEL